METLCTALHCFDFFPTVFLTVFTVNTSKAQGSFGRGKKRCTVPNSKGCVLQNSSDFTLLLKCTAFEP